MVERPCPDLCGGCAERRIPTATRGKGLGNDPFYPAAIVGLRTVVSTRQVYRNSAVGLDLEEFEGVALQPGPPGDDGGAFLVDDKQVDLYHAMGITSPPRNVRMTAVRRHPCPSLTSGSCAAGSHL